MRIIPRFIIIAILSVLYCSSSLASNNIFMEMTPQHAYERGLKYYYQLGYNYNPEAAFKCFYNAASHGNVDAYYYLGQLFRRREGIRYCVYNVHERNEKNRELEQARTQGRLLQFYESEAFEWFLKAANNGHAHALYMIGRCYQKGNCFAYGKSVEKSKVKELEWYQKAAKQGHSIAQCIVENRFIDGVETDINDYVAQVWYYACGLLQVEQWTRQGAMDYLKKQYGIH